MNENEVMITSPMKQTSGYTNEPEHKSATILDSTMLYNPTPGTYEFAINGKWFYINIGNKPRPHGNNIPVMN